MGTRSRPFLDPTFHREHPLKCLPVMKEEITTRKSDWATTSEHQTPIQVDTTTDHPLASIVGAITCDVCTWGVHVVQDMMSSNKSDDEIAKFLIDGCTILHIEKKEVCTGIIPLFENEAFGVIGNPENKPEYICGFLGICPFTPANFTGIITFPSPKPPHVAPVPPAKDGARLKMLHLSDVHMDTLYVPGSTNDCGEPICCRASNGPGTGPTAAGQWGDYKCDVSLPMVTNMFENIAATQDDISFVIWTGDNPPHDVWMQSHETQLAATDRITTMLDKYLPNAQVFPCLGNHEGVPVNTFPLPGMPGSTWLFDALATTWSNWLDASAQETFRYGGYYTMPMDLVENGRVISLNMNWCNNQNLWLIENVTDAANMLQWTVNTLEAAEAAKEKVYIIGHIPTGISDCIDIWAQQFYQIVDRYEDTIVSIFYGHTHHDSIGLYHAVDGSGRPTAVAYVAPSVTTFTDQNPSYRIYTIDEESKYIVESSTYHADVSLANKVGTPQWVLEYNASSTYALTTMFPEDWEAVVQEMSTNATMFESYYNNYYSGSPYPLSKACTAETCTSHYICDALSGYSYQYKACIAAAAKGSAIHLDEYLKFSNSLPRTC
eukprot:gene13615-16022_t